MARSPETAKKVPRPKTQTFCWVTPQQLQHILRDETKAFERLQSGKISLEFLFMRRLVDYPLVNKAAANQHVYCGNQLGLVCSTYSVG